MCAYPKDFRLTIHLYGGFEGDWQPKEEKKPKHTADVPQYEHDTQRERTDFESSWMVCLKKKIVPCVVLPCYINKNMAGKLME